MCGIAGFILKNENKFYNDESKKIIQNMLYSINHRGPDAMGIWEGNNSLTFLGHKRLSILELTNAGSQPMKDETEKLVLTFNGEIYNHLQLRKEIYNSGNLVNWKGTSDTETLLQSIKIFGLEKTLSLIEGMFSFALWDQNQSKLFLVRDRVGEKPLYYSNTAETIIFGSELKALVQFPNFEKNINKSALESLLLHNYIKGPYSIYNKTFKLQPGSILIFDSKTDTLDFKTYYDVHTNIKNSFNNPYLINEQEIVEDIHCELKRVVKDQAVADVEIGCFLSGGIDSSLTTALMQNQSKRDINTFSVGFEETLFDESDYAKEVSSFLGTRHHILNFTQGDAKLLIPELPKIYDEPFADSSQLPTLFVSNLASKSVKVALSGDGGDELFCGYGRYIKSLKISKKIFKIPSILRSQISKIYEIKANIFQNRKFKDEKIIDILLAKKFLDVYKNFVFYWNDLGVIKNKNLKNDLCPQLSYCHDLFENKINSDFSNDFLLQAMELDIYSYLVDDIMVKVDRAAMNFSLETRAPFLNHNLLNKAFKIPSDLRCKNNIQKYILKKIVSKYLPENLFDREKQGFGIPLGYWLRSSLSKWADELLDPSLLDEQGFFESKIITKIWEDHKSGRHSYEYYLWNILMFQSWLNNN
jgi:asparagine synthase (glutamine-hydrolysing)